jgi:hypothetical protein
MKKQIYIPIFLLAAIVSNNAQQKDFPKLTGPYLGQKPPGMKAEVFAPGIVSTEKNEGLFGFFNSGKLFLFSRTDPDFVDWRNEPVYIMEQKNRIWSKPRLSPYIGKPWYLNLPPLPPGKSLYFPRWGGKDGKVDVKTLDIWEVIGTEDGWSELKNLGLPVCSKNDDRFPGISPDGKVLFFTSKRKTFGPYFKKPQTLDTLMNLYLNPGNGLEDIYWVNTKIITKMKMEVIK